MARGDEKSKTKLIFDFLPGFVNAQQPEQDNDQGADKIEAWMFDNDEKIDIRIAIRRTQSQAVDDCDAAHKRQDGQPMKILVNLGPLLGQDRLVSLVSRRLPGFNRIKIACLNDFLIED